MEERTMKNNNLNYIDENLLKVSRLTNEVVLENMGTSMNGFQDERVEELREIYGENKISHEKPDSALKRIFDAFVNPFTIVLFLLAIISLFTDVILVSKKDHDFTSIIIMTMMVTISGVLCFVQETRSNNSAKKLKEMVKTTVAAERNGKKEISLEEVVPGDIIYLAAGDMIPADLRILVAKDLFVAQSALTGESEPVEKCFEPMINEAQTPLECTNIGFMGTNVISGTAIGVVIATGDNTYFSTMAKGITEKKVLTSFDKGVNSVSWLLIKFMMVMVPIVFFVNGFTKGDWLQAFLFALSVAVGLTPEMLPMIVTTNLAKGAVQMAKKKTVVKSLNSIQNFGAMDVLCTDKTGTLTQDKVVLEYHLDIHGNEDMRVLRHAFLNSYYQTGLKNLMDIAILEYADNASFKVLIDQYVKVDEIPFDFNRRRMSVVIKDTSGKTQLITKGAVEEMLQISKYAEYKGNVEVLTDEIKEEILETVEKLNKEGMRVIGIAQKNNPSVQGVFSVNDECEMVLMGYLAFLDPPKESTKAAVEALKNYGVAVKILTGDNDEVTRCICRQVGIKADKILLGSDIDEMDEELLAAEVEEVSIFAKLSPNQKGRIVSVLRENGHIVGFMGDGINDALAMKKADVGISVDTAVDIAKESADIILLEKDLMVLEDGVIEGRRTFGNIIKYIKMTASSNFGNMFSVLVASIALPFLPMLPIQILILNLIYDISCISIPWDNVDKDYLQVPRKWDASSIGKFMLWIGPTSSLFDIVTYAVMFFIICPMVCHGGYNDYGVNKTLFMAVFNAGWFVESLCSQTMVIHIIRTAKIPFINSRASGAVILSTIIAITVGIAIQYTSIGRALQMVSMPIMYFGWLIVILLCYIIVASAIKEVYKKYYGEFL
ncbi:magnesium-translocating P-type ATPase [Clostridium neonatale]|uniref:Magnesium-transporting ATPase, P-type 1 n=2 Tax=Clostridium neonatale TaxID=137838 RepID=A0A2A7MF50_9CLOT|nr:magnesium-translocating P-type ATPase [Clostridium neonatale]PEG26181.1 magnesium-translocating P-type ATPase [Clostridium neonatale]PEG29951.1 magnesium-translocating P-type ATPase [Clostridium neonatale]